MKKVKELYEKVARDAGLQEKFAKIMRDAAAAGEAATRGKLTAFAEEAGFEISFDEVREYAQTLSGRQEGPLSDTELDLVAGGKSEEGTNNILCSIMTLGVGCALASLYKFGGGESCKNIFE